MFEENEFEVETLNKNEKPDMNLKKEDCCVCINIFAKCDEKYPFKKENYPCKEEKKKKEDCCVCINIITECKD